MKEQSFYVYFKDCTECVVEAADFVLDGPVAQFFDHDWNATAAFHGVKGVSAKPLTFVPNREAKKS